VVRPSAPITFAPLLTFSISRKIPTMLERIANKIMKFLRKLDIPAGRKSDNNSAIGPPNMAGKTIIETKRANDSIAR
jgi:maltodextrin utilization protein YvdJ